MALRDKVLSQTRERLVFLKYNQLDEGFSWPQRSYSVCWLEMKDSDPGTYIKRKGK